VTEDDNGTEPHGRDTSGGDVSDLLDGLEGSARRERTELIAWLRDHGFSIEQIRASAAAPLLLPANRAMGDDGVHVSARDICQATGIDLDLLQQLQRAVGLPSIDDPDAAVLSRVDAEAAARAKMFVELGVDPQDAVAVVRVLMEGLGRAAATMRQAAFKILAQPGATEIELAQGSEALALRATPLLGPVIEGLLQLQLRRSFEIEGLNAAERAAGTLPGARNVVVAFADLAGFTRLGEARPPEELEHVASQLADLARDIAVAPVWFIKTIGDAVMLVSPDPVSLLNAVLDLVEAAATAHLPQLRAGVAAGPAVTRAGDWFGSPVNIASRVTGVAHPDTVLVAESAHAVVGAVEQFKWSSAGARHFKGVRGEVKLYRVSRASA
jgi:adenylate cyclase